MRSSFSLRSHHVKQAAPTLSSYMPLYLLKNPKRVKQNSPYITLKKEEHFFWGGGRGVRKQLVVCLAGKHGS